MKRTNILVAEDNRILVEEMYSGLREIPGVDLDVAYSEAEAVAAIRRKCFDLAFIDIHLRDDGKDRGGIAVIKAIHSLREGTQMVVVSGTGDVNAAVSAYRSGILDFIAKGQLTDGAATVRGIVESFIANRDSVKMNVLGGHSSVVSLISEPEFMPIWESNMCARLGTSHDILRSAIENALGPRLPILRKIGKEPVFTDVQGARAVSGIFWSRGIGAALKIALAFPDVDIDSLGIAVGEPIYKKSYRNLTVRVWLEPAEAREGFDDSIWTRAVGVHDAIKGGWGV